MGKEDANERNRSLSDIRKALVKLNDHLEAFSQNVEKSAQKITRGCFTVGSLGAIHKDDLLKKAQEIKNLSFLLLTAGRKLEQLSDRLGESQDQDRVLYEILNYCQFVNDQILSEQNDANRILMLIRAQNQLQSRQE